LPGWRNALMPAAWVTASITVTSPRWRSCSLVMMSMLAGVSNGVSCRNEPVAALSRSVGSGVSPDTEMAGRVATDAASASCARAGGCASTSASAAETAVRRGRTDVLAEGTGMGSLGSKKDEAVALATVRAALTENERRGARPERGAWRSECGGRRRRARGDAQRHHGGRRRQRGRRGGQGQGRQRRADRADRRLLGVLRVLVMVGLVGAFHPRRAGRRAQLDQRGAGLAAGHEALRHQRLQREQAQRQPDDGAVSVRDEGAGGKAHHVAILNYRLQSNAT